MVADQIGSPTYVGDLVAALLQIADGAIREPVLHAANAGAASRFEQAQAVFEDARRRPGARAAGGQRPASASRAAPAVLGAVGRQVRPTAGLTPLRPWREALAAALGRPGRYPRRREID